MRGEYKVPGGKLVAVDIDVEDDRIVEAHVSGDFFLDPDEALVVINRSLVGQKADASAGALAAAVTNAINRAEHDVAFGVPVTMVGFDAHAVAMAVRRALGFASSWHDHTFTYLDTGSMPPPWHAALDEVLGAETAAGRRGPTLRFWYWDSAAVVIGSFQSLRNEVDMDAANALDVEVVRRVSGGGAMFMEANNCITFSLVVPASLVDGMSFEQSYAFLDDWVLEALGSVGVQARYAGLNDIASPVGKIAGAAQKRFAPRDGGPGAVLHHVTMAYDIDADKMMQVLRIGREKLSDKGTKSANKRVDPVRSQTKLGRDEVIERFLTTFRRRYTTIDGELTAAERTQADELTESKFRNPQWTARVP